MFNMIRHRYVAGLLLGVITLLTATACSTTKVAKEDNGITIELVDSKRASISRAYLSRSDNQLFLKGEVKSRPPGHGHIPGHLHVTLIDSQGKIIKEADISYSQRGVKSTSASFKTKLPEDLSASSTIRITHFETQTHEPVPEEAVWREVQH